MQPRAILLGLNFLDISYGQKYFLLAAHQIKKSQKMSSCGETWWHAGSPLAFGRRAHSHFTKPLCFTQLYIAQGVCRHCLHVYIVCVTVYYTVRSTFQFHQTPTLGA